MYKYLKILRKIGSFKFFCSQYHEFYIITFLLFLGHTMTYNPLDQSLYIIGGFSEKYGFSNTVLHLDKNANHLKIWPTSGLSPLQGIYGHSTVFQTTLKSFYVYGGMLYKNRYVLCKYSILIFAGPN